MVDLLSGSQMTITLTDDERSVLFLLLHAETVSAVHAIVTAHIPPPDKTNSIINQMDFAFQLRAVIWAATAPNNQMTIGELPRQVLERLVEQAQEDLMATDVVLMYRQTKQNLLLKLNSGAGFISTLERATHGTNVKAD